MVELFLKNVISVVTVVLNDVNNIEGTIQSVLSQVGCDIEYIVMDGGSSDGTLDVIEKYRDRIQHYRSEKDQGIYFAMNKAIDAAEGQWMIFLNSGDTFFSTTVLRDVFFRISSNSDVIYGQHMIKYEGSVIRKELPGNIEDIWKGMFFSHQAMFVRTGLLKKNHFDCNFKLASDYELVAKLFHLGCHFIYVPKVIAVISAEGISDNMRTAVFRENARISAIYFPNKPYRIYFILKCVDGFFRTLAKQIFPRQLIRRMQATNKIFRL